MSVLPDVMAANLAVVFCGSAVGSASARRGAYYAGPGNVFWPTLFEVGLTPRLLKPSEYPQVLDYGLGLTDLAKHVSGSDDTLSKGDFDRKGLRTKIERYEPRILAFTSKRAAEEYLVSRVQYGLLPEAIGSTRLFVLPSPSGAVRRFWDKAPWHELARLRNGAEPVVAAASHQRASPAGSCR